MRRWPSSVSRPSLIGEPDARAHNQAAKKQACRTRHVGRKAVQCNCAVPTRPWNALCILGHGAGVLHDGGACVCAGGAKSRVIFTAFGAGVGLGSAWQSCQKEVRAQLACRPHPIGMPMHVMHMHGQHAHPVRPAWMTAQPKGKRQPLACCRKMAPSCPPSVMVWSKQTVLRESIYPLPIIVVPPMIDQRHCSSRTWSLTS